jgi:SAM-dependent methyltransferase
MTGRWTMLAPGRGCSWKGNDLPDTNDALRRYWDDDASTYDLWPEHGAFSALERAAWAYELSRFLPASGARLLDVGAGTGFLSLAAARLGYEVTALDMSRNMLARLEMSAAQQGLKIETVCASAEDPPQGPFDAVIERLLLWTLPDPPSALRAWKRVAGPGARLLVFEGLWTGGGYGDAVRRRGRKLLHQLRQSRPEHHAPYSPELMEALPLARHPAPEHFLGHVEGAGWRNPRLSRLRDVEFARVARLSRLEQLLGTSPEYVIQADSD